MNLPIIPANPNARAPVAIHESAILGTPDVLVIYNQEEEHYTFTPNTAAALVIMLAISPEGCDGMTVGAPSPQLPWIGAYFMAETLRDQHGLVVAERIVGEPREEDEDLNEEDAHEAGACYPECSYCADEENEDENDDEA